VPKSDIVPASLTAPLTGLPRFLILCLVAALVAVPLLATALGGFKELGELRTNPFGLPKVWQWENYWGILESARYWRILGNSLFIATVTVALTLAVAAPAALPLRICASSARSSCSTTSSSV
jgi:raffinose/stachyose/melibiose transport system permease protein